MPYESKYFLSIACGLLLALPLAAQDTASPPRDYSEVHKEMAGWENAMACLDRKDKACASTACNELIPLRRWLGEYCLIRVNGHDDDRLDQAFEALKADLGPESDRVKNDLIPIEKLRGRERRAAIDAALSHQVDVTALIANFEKRNQDNIRRNLRSNAEEGDAKSQYDLGMAYGNGELPGIERNLALAIQWFSRAAEQGYAPAEFSMGYSYEHGMGVPKDRNQAATWYGKAAEHGSATSMYRLGRLLSDGESDPADDIPKANRLLLEAANAGLADAQNSIGIHYQFGIGFAQNYPLAADWYRKAASQGHSWAQNNLGILAENGLGMPKDHAAAARWYELAAEQGLSQAKWRLAGLVLEGWGTEKDPARAMALYREAANDKEPEGWNGLGYLHENGIGIRKSLDVARTYYLLSANAGNAHGMFNLSRLLQDSDPSKAFEWEVKAAELGHATAQNNAGASYQHGVGVRANTAWALYWYAKAAQQGNERARNNIAKLLPEREHATVTIAGANLRASPSTEAEVLTTLPRGSRVYPIDEPAPEWREVYVESGHRLGYLANSVLEVSSSRRESATAASNDGWPARPEPRPGSVTCNTNCRNGDCRRTYSDGRRVRFQAQQKWNPLSNQFEWDSGGC